MNYQDKIISISRQYVAICPTGNFDNYYCRQFKLPEEYENNSRQASWYFLNKLDFFSCVELVIPLEAYMNKVILLKKQSILKRSMNSLHYILTLLKR